MLESVKQEGGGDALHKRLGLMGARVGNHLRSQYPALRSRSERVLKLAELMEQLGYNTASTKVLDPTVISANNCVFHDLVLKDPAVCQFDLALLATSTGSRVGHQECMAKGGHVCRFKFRP